MSAPAERLLSARELADLLGFSSATIQDWAERRRLRRREGGS
jgi:predicted DNA-binding transcriptional regulator AlpA